MNEIPKVVFSRTLEHADWPESRVARGDLADEIATLKNEPGGDLLAWGGAAFAQSLSKLGLVDEYRLILQPVALGEGLPLFKDLRPTSASGIASLGLRSRQLASHSSALFWRCSLSSMRSKRR